MYTCLFLIGILLSGVKCGYYFVTFPSALRLNNEETAVVSVFGLKNAEVKVWLQHGDKKFSEQTVNVENEETPSYVKVKVTENDLFENAVEEKPSVIKICSEWLGETQSREVMLSYETGYLMIQTDRPIYTPLQRVNVRTLALDESLKAADGWHVAMDLISPSNLTMERKISTVSQIGFFERMFYLPPFPELGAWTIRAFYTEPLETEARTQFEVQEYDAQTFGVTVEVDRPYILPDDTEYIQVTVRAKYTYGKPVDGNARLALSIIYQNGTKKYILSVGKRILEHVEKTETGSVTEFVMSCADIIDPISDGDFPAGSRLEVLATVFESSTGKTLAAKHAETVFAREPYIFKFTRSKLHFQPGMLYYLKVDMLYANGHPVMEERIKVTMIDSNENNTKETITNSKGQAESIFLTFADTDKISFFASTTDDRYVSEFFEVTADVGQNLLQLEHSIRGDTLLLQAFTNVPDAGYTGMFFVIVTRGKIVYTKFRPAVNLATETVDKDLLQKLSPSARLLVFYVDKNSNELVVNSIKFDVERKCQGEGLNLETTKTEVRPGTADKLTATGSPLMWVGLSISDKALFSHKSRNVLQKNKMFDVLESHDLGCGEGGGSTSAEVFKKSGLTVLTNADVSGDDLVQYTDECGKNQRRKRDNRVDSEGDRGRGERNILRRSLDGEKSEYDTDLERLADYRVRPRIASDFRESFLFDVVQLDSDGQTTKTLFFPDSITEWRIQALGVSPDKGICIADALDIKSFMWFFVQLDLPYKVVRLERTEVKATIFNYGTIGETDIEANVYLEVVENICYNGEPGMPVKISLPPNSAKTVTFPIVPLMAGLFPIKVTATDTEREFFPLFHSAKKNLYVVNEGVEERVSIHVCLDPYNQMDDCRNDQRVIHSDVLNNGGVYRVDLTLPANSIPQTGEATAYIQITDTFKSYVVPTSIDGVEIQLRKAYGDGETTLFILAQTVYAMSYLIEEKGRTRELTKGIMWIWQGVVRAQSIYRHPDGSFAAWQSRQSSTWLTAFAAKVFCQARKVMGDVFDVIDKENLKPTIDWLIHNVNEDGEFVEHNPVLRRSYGQISNPSLTAFVLISLLECDIISPVLEDTVRKVTVYLENLSEEAYKSNPFLLAISTYALALTDSRVKYKLKEYLNEMLQQDLLYSGTPETPSYALLAMITFKDLKKSSIIAKWLVSKKNADGFKTLQDTVVGLQAISQYSKAISTASESLKVSLLAQDYAGQEIYLTGDNLGVQYIAKNLPVESGDNQLTVNVSGTATAIMTIDLRYNRPATQEEICPFVISDPEVEVVDDNQFDAEELKKCDVCGRCEEEPEEKTDNDYDSDYFFVPEVSRFSRRKRYTSRKAKTCLRFSVGSANEEVHTMVVVKVSLQTGVGVVKEDIEKLLESNKNIAEYEMSPDGRDFVLFYLNEVTSDKTQFIFRMVDNFEGDVYYRQPSSVKVYKYYNPDQTCTRLYGTGPNSGPQFECDGGGHCSCIQGMCIKPVEDEIKQLARKGSRPALKLFRYTCNAEKANYAVHVLIESLGYDHEKNLMIANGHVLKSIHKGVENLENGDSITFIWYARCEMPDLQLGKKYFIIGKDGILIQSQTGPEYRYPLTGTALVIKDEGRRGDKLLYTTVRRYQIMMSRLKGGCVHK